MIINRLNKLFSQSHELYLVIIIVIYVLFVSFFNRSFLSLGNLIDILNSSSVLIILAIGAMIVMVSGGIDISFTSIAAVTMWLTVFLMNNYQGNIFLAFILASIISIALGSINAIIISYFKLPTLIVTLATSNILYGLLLESVPTAHLKTVPEYLVKFGRGQIYGIPYIIVSTFVILILTSIFLKFTQMGRNIYAIGNNLENAKRSGISIVHTQFMVYCLAGFMAGVASFLYVSLYRYVNPFNVYGLIIDVIAAVVLGGASLAGGYGSVLGTFLGAFLLSLIRNSLIMMGAPSIWDSAVVGFVILIGVGLTVIREKRRKNYLNIG